MNTISKMGRSDYLFLGLTILSLIGSCLILSPKKLFWNDELYSWHLLSDPSFLHMWQAFADSINNTPPLYFLLGWPWAKLFSASELSLRLFSSLGMSLSLALIWATLRRGYSFWPTALATISIFTSSLIIIEQNVEARMYGLFLAAGAWCFLLFDRICRQERPARRLLWWNFAAHAALIHAHLHGAFYSGAILAAFVLYDWLSAAMRPKVYLSVILSWLTILLYLPAFFSQSAAGQPRSWLPEPVLRDLTDLLLSSSELLSFKLLTIVLVLLVAWQVVGKKIGEPAVPLAAPLEGRVHVLIFGLAMLAVPVGVWFFSKIGRPIFLPRYLIPTAIGYAILLAHIFEQLSPLPWKWPGDRRGQLVYLAIFAVLAAFLLRRISAPLFSALKKENEFAAERMVNEGLHPDLPVVFQYSGDFNQYHHYFNTANRFYYVLDEEAAKAWESGRFGYQEHKHMVALQRNYPRYFNGQIIESDDFLSRFDRFLVLDYLKYDLACPESGPVGLDSAYAMLPIHCPQWLERRILDNPEYEVEKLADNGWNALLLISRKQKQNQNQ